MPYQCITWHLSCLWLDYELLKGMDLQCTSSEPSATRLVGIYPRKGFGVVEGANNLEGEGLCGDPALSFTICVIKERVI